MIACWQTGSEAIEAGQPAGRRPQARALHELQCACGATYNVPCTVLFLDVLARLEVIDGIDTKVW
jgi:hypothetical protein